jgi:tetratricopeptide (TPR) repeat protein
VTRNAWIPAALAVALAPAGLHAQESMAFATLENGTSLGFALVRTGERGPSAAMGEVVLPRSNSVSRVLWDKESGAYFGYRVDIERREGVRPFRVTLRSLDRGAVERELKQRSSTPGSPQPAPLGAGPQFPGPQQLEAGEALTLELLANPSTGERIFDVVQISTRPIAGEAMRSTADRVLEGQRAVRRAAELFAAGEYSAAADEYRRALTAQPNDATVHNLLAMCYQHQGNESMARRHYDRALAIRPSYAEVWNNIGTLEQSRLHFKEAVRAYRKSVGLKPGLPTTWKNMGNAYLALGDVQQAFEAYQEALRLDPTIIAGGRAGVPAAGIAAGMQSYYLAKLLAQNAQVNDAIELLRKAKEAGFRDFAKVESDPVFRDVVKDPRYKEITAR